MVRRNESFGEGSNRRILFNKKSENGAMSTTKRDLVMKIAEDTGLIRQDVCSVIQRPWLHNESLAKGDNVDSEILVYLKCVNENSEWVIIRTNRGKWSRFPRKVRKIQTGQNHASGMCRTTCQKVRHRSIPIRKSRPSQ